MGNNQCCENPDDLNNPKSRTSVPGETPYPNRLERKKSNVSSSSQDKNKKNGMTASRTGSQGILKGDNINA